MSERIKTAPINEYRLPQDTAEALSHLGQILELPHRFEGADLAPDLVARYRRELYKEVPGIAELHQAMEAALDPYGRGPGYIIIDGLPEAEGPRDHVVPTAISTLAGTPLNIAPGMGFWQELGVDLSLEEFRFGGIGTNPMHIDLVTATEPPDMLTFYSKRTDPQGGGINLLSSTQQLVKELSPEEIALLQEPRFSEGRWFNLLGVGERIDPFPILEERPDGLWWVRFTGKMIATEALLTSMRDQHGAEITDLLVKIGTILERNSTQVLLGPQKQLIASQILLAHGRQPLGKSQEVVPAPKRRLIWQSYISRQVAV